VAQLEGGEKFMKTVSRVPTSSVGTPQFQSWLSDFRYGLSVLKSDNARQILSPCLDYIDVSIRYNARIFSDKISLTYCFKAVYVHVQTNNFGCVVKRLH
jgi:hypothetical protein